MNKENEQSTTNNEQLNNDNDYEFTFAIVFVFVIIFVSINHILFLKPFRSIEM